MVTFTELKALLIKWVGVDYLQCMKTYKEHTVITKEIVEGRHCPTSGAVCSLWDVALVNPTFHLRQDEMEGLVLGAKLLLFPYEDVLSEALDVHMIYPVGFFY